MTQSASTDALRDILDRARQAPGDTIAVKDVVSLAQLALESAAETGSIDTGAMGREVEALSASITAMKREVAALKPQSLKEDRLPQAGRELDAIVRQTEEATNMIMAAAEEIMGIAGEDETAMAALMRIFEACAFQDITGQRINKVVETLKFIDERVAGLAGVMGITLDEEADVPEEEDEKRKRELLLNGPQAAGEGVSQDDVDALFGGDEVGGQVDQDAIDSLFD
jgi:chemotaxis protein CheZ